MKIILGIIFAIVLGVLGWTLWNFVFGEPPKPAETPSDWNPFPPSTDTPSPTGVQPGTTDASLGNSFVNQIQNANEITLGASVIVEPYALQSWGDENKGGEALLKRQGNEWLLITMGGGAWDVDALVEEGVPQAIAKQLVEKSDR